MNLRYLVVFTILIAALFPVAAAAAMSSANYRVTTTVMSGGGAIMDSGHYRVNGTLGQPSPIDPIMPLQSPGYDLSVGFWYTLHTELGGCRWDIEPAFGDGDVDGADLAEFVNAFSIEQVPSFAQEFGRIDCLP